MCNRENVTPVMVYLPNELVGRVDKDRGSFSRSGYLAVMTAMYFEELSNYENNAYIPRM